MTHTSRAANRYNPPPDQCLWSADSAADGRGARRDGRGSPRSRWSSPATSPRPRKARPTSRPTLARAAERVAEYFARAQSLVCLEIVHLQPLGSGLSVDGVGRTVESELRLSWDSGR